MSREQKKNLAALYEEMRNIQVFDRIHDYASDANPAEDRAYAVRQARRKQIIDEIARLRASKPEHHKPAQVTGVVAFLCAVGYAMLHYLLLR